MSTKKPAAARDSARKTAPASGRAVALRAGWCWLAVVVLGGAAAVGFVSSSSVAAAAGLLFGLLLAALATSAVFMFSGRGWFLVGGFLLTGCYLVSVGVTSVGYLAADGDRYRATAVSSECHHVKGGTACTARVDRPDGTLLVEDLAVKSRMKLGETVDVVEDRAGIVAPHRADQLDSDALPADLGLLAVSAALLAGLFGWSAWLGVRRPLKR
ncbi:MULTISPECIES: hypothetical protein [Actinomycetes]|uniref:hypothetical protein n=1 Tax=Actinomycetes TaxID=1760 RepID=UPI00131A03CC|nr:MULTISPECIES: hypothetical protein [Actinomycetes]